MGLQTPLNNTIYGTILAGGTLSSEFNVQGYALLGLIATSNSVLGTLGFMVSDLPDVPYRPGTPAGVYRSLVGSNGVAVAVGPVSGQFGLSSEALLPVKGYQYIRVSTTAQTTGLALTLILKSD
jgi:hypothetical protein